MTHPRQRAARIRLARVPAAHALAHRLGPPARRLHPGRGPAVWSLLVLAGALSRTAPLHDAVTGAAIPEARLVLPAAYVALAPLCDVADAIAGLPLHAHYALMLGVLAAGLAWPTRGRTALGGAAGIAREAGWRLARAVACVVALYLVAVLVPRPVPRLAMHDPDAVVVDFHSHTSASHDGRRGFSARANRAWHAAAGFDVAYVTDHATFASTADAVAGNPRRAGDGTVLLPGVEVRHDGQHLNVLGTEPADSLAYVGGELREASFAAQAARYAEPRIVLLTVPADLGRLTAASDIDAVELSDGAPRGLEQGDRDRGALVALADRRRLAVLAGSDNHGWATNVVAWSVLRVPGWRAMTPDALDRAIRRTIHERRRDAVQVVERRSVLGPGAWFAMDEIPTRAWMTCRALTVPERLAWLAWLWLPWSLRRALGRRAVERRRRDRTRPVADLAA